jgi:hypothetical protein
MGPIFDLLIAIAIAAPAAACASADRALDRVSRRDEVHARGERETQYVVYEDDAGGWRVNVTPAANARGESWAYRVGPDCAVERLSAPNATEWPRATPCALALTAIREQVGGADWMTFTLSNAGEHAVVIDEDELPWNDPAALETSLGNAVDDRRLLDPVFSIGLHDAVSVGPNAWLTGGFPLDGLVEGYSRAKPKGPLRWEYAFATNEMICRFSGSVALE